MRSEGGASNYAPRTVTNVVGRCSRCWVRGLKSEFSKNSLSRGGVNPLRYQVDTKHTTLVGVWAQI